MKFSEAMKALEEACAASLNPHDFEANDWIEVT